jgi:hypothetical protein
VKTGMHKPQEVVISSDPESDKESESESETDSWIMQIQREKKMTEEEKAVEREKERIRL